jgi:hypothetical protein
MTRNLHPISVSFVFLVINVLILLVILAMNRRTGARSGQAAPSGQGTSEGGTSPIRVGVLCLPRVAVFRLPKALIVGWTQPVARPVKSIKGGSHVLNAIPSKGCQPVGEKINER